MSDDQERAAVRAMDIGMPAATVQNGLPGEIFALTDLPDGQREPSQKIRDETSARLYQYAEQIGLKGSFTQRAGVQYKIMGTLARYDVLQYYIVRRYGHDVKV